jgi:hypothetical protein
VGSGIILHEQGHWQSAATHFAMLTFLASLVTIQGCCNSCRGYGLSAPSRIKLPTHQHLVTDPVARVALRRPVGRVYPSSYSPRRHEALDRLCPDSANGRVVHHNRHRGGHDVRQQLDGRHVLRLAVGREREAEMGNFVQGQTEGPDVGGNAVWSPLDSLGLE